MTAFFMRMKRDEAGATAIEYGLLAAIVSIALITGGETLGMQVEKTVVHLADSLRFASNR